MPKCGEHQEESQKNLKKPPIFFEKTHVLDDTILREFSKKI